MASAMPDLRLPS